MPEFPGGCKVAINPPSRNCEEVSGHPIYVYGILRLKEMQAMLIRIRKSSDIPPSEITPEALYLDRRRFLAGGAAAALGFSIANVARAEDEALPPILPGVKPGPYGTAEDKTPWDAVTSYNNFYEFGLDKDDPKRNAGRLQTEPWTVKIDGEVQTPKTIGIDDILKSIDS